MARERVEQDVAGGPPVMRSASTSSNVAVRRKLSANFGAGPASGATSGCESAAGRVSTRRVALAMPWSLHGRKRVAQQHPCVRLQVARQAAGRHDVGRQRVAAEREPDPVPGGVRLHAQDLEQPELVVRARLQPRDVRERPAPDRAQGLERADEAPAGEVQRRRRQQPVRLTADAQHRQRALRTHEVDEEAPRGVDLGVS